MTSRDRFHSDAYPPRLLDQVREKLRLKHYSIRTEQAYLDWIKRFILFHGKKHPGAMDVDFEYAQIMVRDGKGDKDRVTMLPGALAKPINEHLQKIKAVHEQDLRDGFGEVYLPHALARKYPKAGREWGWQYVFPASKTFDRSTIANGAPPSYR